MMVVEPFVDSDPAVEPDDVEFRPRLSTLGIRRISG